MLRGTVKRVYFQLIENRASTYTKQKTPLKFQPVADRTNSTAPHYRAELNSTIRPPSQRQRMPRTNSRDVCYNLLTRIKHVGSCCRTQLFSKRNRSSKGMLNKPLNRGAIIAELSCGFETESGSASGQWKRAPAFARFNPSILKPLITDLNLGSAFSPRKTMIRNPLSGTV